MLLKSRLGGCRREIPHVLFSESKEECWEFFYLLWGLEFRRSCSIRPNFSVDLQKPPTLPTSSWGCLIISELHHAVCRIDFYQIKSFFKFNIATLLRMWHVIKSSFSIKKSIKNVMSNLYMYVHSGTSFFHINLYPSAQEFRIRRLSSRDWIPWNSLQTTQADKKKNSFV